MTLNRTARSASQSRSVYHAFINKRIAPCGFVALGHSFVSRAFPASFMIKKSDHHHQHPLVFSRKEILLSFRSSWEHHFNTFRMTTFASSSTIKTSPTLFTVHAFFIFYLISSYFKLSFAKWFPYCHTQNCRFQRVCACSYHQHLWESKNFQFGSTTRIIFWLRSRASRRKRGTFTNENEIENNSYILVLLFSFEQSIWHNDRDRD